MKQCFVTKIIMKRNQMYAVLVYHPIDNKRLVLPKKTKKKTLQLNLPTSGLPT